MSAQEKSVILIYELWSRVISLNVKILAVINFSVNYLHEVNKDAMYTLSN